MRLRRTGWWRDADNGVKRRAETHEEDEECRWDNLAFPRGACTALDFLRTS